MSDLYVKDESGNIRAFMQVAAELACEVERKREEVELEKLRPFYMLRPSVFIDGNQWCALYGANLQDGVAGFGNTPSDAARQFDIEWLNAKPPTRSE